MNACNNVVCLFSASFDHRETLSALLTIFTLLSFLKPIYAFVLVRERIVALHVFTGRKRFGKTREKE